ncbi:MAG: hypothetical protein LLG37_01060 [Spirochaetia bacterium]|nr:hypothetical protein [Spirochaetia bacterium]
MGLFDGLFLLLAAPSLLRIEYDGMGIYYRDMIGNIKSIYWTDVVSMKYSIMEVIEIVGADRAKISFSFILRASTVCCRK